MVCRLNDQITPREPSDARNRGLGDESSVPLIFFYKGRKRDMLRIKTLFLVSALIYLSACVATVHHP